MSIENHGLTPRQIAHNARPKKATAHYMAEAAVQHGGAHLAPPLLAIAPDDAVHPPTVIPLAKGVHRAMFKKSAAHSEEEIVRIVGDEERVLFAGSPADFDALKSAIAAKEK